MKVNFFRVTTGTMFATIATATSLRQALDSAMAETTLPDLYLSQVDSTADTEASLLGATSPMMSFDWGFDSMGQHLAQTDNLAEANIIAKIYRDPPRRYYKRGIVMTKSELKAEQQKISAK